MWPLQAAWASFQYGSRGWLGFSPGGPGLQDKGPSEQEAGSPFMMQPRKTQWYVYWSEQSEGEGTSMPTFQWEESQGSHSQFLSLHRDLANILSNSLGICTRGTCQQVLVERALCPASLLLLPFLCTISVFSKYRVSRWSPAREVILGGTWVALNHTGSHNASLSAILTKRRTFLFGYGKFLTHH